jgi:Mn-containing catalase
MILRYDRLGIEIPAGDPDPAGAMAVQELMGGRLGEMSTLMNYKEVVAVFKGPHPETGEDLRVEHPAPEGFPWPEAPAQPDVFAPDYAPDGITEIAQKLRSDAGV